MHLQGGWKNWHHFCYAFTLPNINRFSKLFHCRNQDKICNNTITKELTTPQCQVCMYVAAFHWSHHWSVASPAWVRRPAARRTHWTFDVKSVTVTGCDTCFRQRQWKNFENRLIFGKVKAYKNGANFWAILQLSAVSPDEPRVVLKCSLHEFTECLARLTTYKITNCK